jgi:lipopolysaccharide/colanic/teichoic acid biosynthesis glycosyltransferase
MKRLFDCTVACCALLVLALPILFLAWQIRNKLGRPILFKQTRAGLHGRPFTMLKFRTMTNERDSEGVLLSDAKRLTVYGGFLRSTSLDELPQLWNVFRGEMSLVGPRPLLIEYLSNYTSEQARRLDVQPGITGWAQINGRNTLAWEEKFRLDVWYVDHRSFWLDLRILLITIWRVISREGITAAGEASMAPFRCPTPTSHPR